jgi:hypothetical protein
VSEEKRRNRNRKRVKRREVEKERGEEGEKKIEERRRECVVSFPRNFSRRLPLSNWRSSS